MALVECTCAKTGAYATGDMPEFFADVRAAVERFLFHKRRVRVAQKAYSEGAHMALIYFGVHLGGLHILAV